MKTKLLTFALLSSLLLSAHAESVYSNIVGMMKITVEPDSFNLISLPFEGSSGDITLGEAFETVADQTTIYVWTNLAYNEYTFFSAAPGWFAPGFVPSDDVTIPKGSSVWVKASSSQIELVHSGGVTEDTSIDVNFGVGFNLISVPYPIQTTLGDLDVTDISDGDVIYIWNGSGYDEYTYFSAAPGWFAPGFVPSESVVIPTGAGFWLSTTGTGLLTFNKTY